VKIGHNMLGGVGDSSGSVSSAGKIADVRIGGSLIGGLGTSSGQISSGGDIGTIAIGHDVKGGSGDESGKIDVGGKLGSLKIGGSLIGGSGDYDTATHYGQVFIGTDVGSTTIGKNVQGGSGKYSGRIEAKGDFSNLIIGGSLIGGSGAVAGEIISVGNLGPVIIGHDIRGGTGSHTGRIEALGKLVSISVGGSLIGGSNDFSGQIYSSDDMGQVRIRRDVLGGSGAFSGQIDCGGDLTGVAIGGSLIGGSNRDTGEIYCSGEVGHVKIGHDLVGGSITGTMASLDKTGVIKSGNGIVSVSIGGSIIAGADASTSGDLTNNATISAGDSIGAVTVKGSLIGNDSLGGKSIVIITARGERQRGSSADLAIGTLTIGGRVEFAQIFAGYHSGPSPHNPDAQIGAVAVGGDWAASSIIAGSINLGADNAPGGILANADNVNFGNLHDAKIRSLADSPTIHSRIGSITIAGHIFGRPTSSGNVNSFGFVAEEIGALKVGGAIKKLSNGPNNDGKSFGQTNSITLHEIQSPIGSTQPFGPSARLVNSHAIAYTDIDGDQVVVTISKPVLTAGNVNAVFKFDNGGVGGPSLNGQQLQLIDLAALATNGLNLAVTVTAGGGDRLANIGYIKSKGFDLGTVTIPGDLGRIDAGDLVPATAGLKSLYVRTLGRLGLDTQPAASGAFTPSLYTDINGGLGSLWVKQDINGATINSNLSIGPVTIGGSIIGGKMDDSGTVYGEEISIVKIGRDLQGGTGNSSGQIYATEQIGSATIGGSLIGGEGIGSASIIADGKSLGAVKIRHNVLGGTGPFTATIKANTEISGVSIGGSFVGGIGDSSGWLNSTIAGERIGAVTIGHNLIGGAGNESGKIDSAGKLTSVLIGGSLIGGSGDYGTFNGNFAQVISLGNMGVVNIGGDLAGGAGLYSGKIKSGGTLYSVRIGGSLVGDSGATSGNVESTGAMGPVTIGGNFVGGAGEQSGCIFSGSTIANMIIGGSICGGSGANGSAVIGSIDVLGPLHIGGNILGGSGEAGGRLDSLDKMAAITIGGSVIGGSGQVSASIRSIKDIGFVRIGGDLIGGSISDALSLVGSGSIESGRIASVAIGGSIIAGIDNSIIGSLIKNASIRAVDDIGSLTVKGSLIGNSLSPVIISARGQETLAPNATTDMAIRRLSVGKRVEWAQILAGYDVDLTAMNTRASVGTVSVGGDWIASDLVAGVRTDSNQNPPNLFGDADDQPIIVLGGGDRPLARIGSILIQGVTVGTASGADHFGFVAEVIGTFKSLGFIAGLTPGSNNDVLELSPMTGDVTIREV
jgi:hypothetical protein